MSDITVSSMEIQYVVEKDYKLKQLTKNFGRDKRAIVKYFSDFKYVHIFDNRKDAKFKGITLGYDELLQLQKIVEWMGKTDAYYKKVMLHVLSPSNILQFTLTTKKKSYFFSVFISFLNLHFSAFTRDSVL
jgi:hypothetical protein